MESMSLSHAISSMFQRPNPVVKTRFWSQTWRSQLVPVRSKQSHFKDFQDYAKPLRLLQTEEVKTAIENLDEEVFSSGSKHVTCALYSVELGTSRISGSSLSDTNAGVLLCLIDENGDSILQRISSSSDDDLLLFQQGSLAEFAFEGPKLGRVEALWVGLESGQWRIDKVSLTVICVSLKLSEEESEKESKYTSVRYDFEAEDIHLGEGRDTSMIELRPCQVTELSGNDLSAIKSTSLENPQNMSNEETMKEYTDLKFSLLLYDATLVLIGTSLANYLSGQSAGFAFLGGGTGGFFYLLLLQRSVDGISRTQNVGTVSEVFEGFKGPISGIALAIGFALFVVKYGSGDFGVEFTAKDLVFGMMGFLACKVSVVLAAFKPIPKKF